MQNPYIAPRAALDDMPGEVQRVRIFAVSGRIGRARYILYTSALPLLGLLLSGLWLSTVHSLGSFDIILITSCWGAIAVVFILLTIQRSHDFDMGGALAVLGLVPLVNLVFWIIPGNDGHNRFGPPTPPNSKTVLIGACIVPVLLFLLIAATTLVPGLDRP